MSKNKGVIVPKLTAKQISKLFTDKVEELEQRTIYYLTYLGEKCLREMRQNYTYIDDTGNLTSSMGYIVCHYGAVVGGSGFNPGSGKHGVNGTDGDGTIKGKAFIESLRSNYSSVAYILIVVAGMEYASYVAKYKNVTQSAQLLAEQQMPLIIKKIFGGK